MRKSGAECNDVAFVWADRDKWVVNQNGRRGVLTVKLVDRFKAGYCEDAPYMLGKTTIFEGDFVFLRSLAVELIAVVTGRFIDDIGMALPVADVIFDVTGLSGLEKSYLSVWVKDARGVEG